MAEPTRASFPDWIWPRADSHVVLGVPGSLDVLKTFVEPGGSFSPGVGTFGVSVWVWLGKDQRLVAPELLPREAIRDRLLGGKLPVMRSRWRAGALEVELRLGCEGVGDRYRLLDTLWCKVRNRGEERVQATVLLVVRSLGPAGGAIRSIAFSADVHGFMIHDTARVIGAHAPREAGCVSLSGDGHDISVPLRRGELPRTPRAFDREGYCGGCLAYPLTLDAAEEWESWWDFPIHAQPPEPTQPVLDRCRHDGKARLDVLADDWRERLCKVQITAADARFEEAFHACLGHLLMAYVGDEPRIAPVCYPMLWTRDAVYALNALDKAGLSDWSRAGLRAMMADPWAGGFGPEADAPGEQLWALGQHYWLHRDLDFVQETLPGIAERVELIRRMRSVTTPWRVPATNLLPQARQHPEHDLVCEAATDGLIIGRMDWHRPLFWVNAWAYAGLRAASEMAAAIGEEDLAAAWASDALEVAAALGHGPIRFGSNERDLVCAIWPTHACRPDDPRIAEAFDTWWHQRRYDGQGRYRGEPRWRYFELGQAHNLLRLGHRDRALLTLEQFLRAQDAPGLYAWAEGDWTGDPVGDWRLVRGWWPESKIMPHAWAQAEMALLLRDLFVYRENDYVVLGAGVREEWLGDPAGVGITDAPTGYGPVTWHLRPVAEGRYSLLISCPTPPPGGYRLRLPLPASSIVDLEGAGIREEAGDWPLRTEHREVQLSVSVY